MIAIPYSDDDLDNEDVFTSNWKSKQYFKTRVYLILFFQQLFTIILMVIATRFFNE